MKNYYLIIDAKQNGPYSFEELKNLSFKKETLVWYDGLDNWTRAEDLDELNEYVKILPPPIPYELTNKSKDYNINLNILKENKQNRPNNSIDWNLVKSKFAKEVILNLKLFVFPIIIALISFFILALYTNDIIQSYKVCLQELKRDSIQLKLKPTELLKTDYSIKLWDKLEIEHKLLPIINELYENGRNKYIIDNYNPYFYKKSLPDVYLYKEFCESNSYFGFYSNKNIYFTFLILLYSYALIIILRYFYLINIWVYNWFRTNSVINK